MFMSSKSGSKKRHQRMYDEISLLKPDLIGEHPTCDKIPKVGSSP